MTTCDALLPPPALARLRPRRDRPLPTVLQRGDLPPWEWTGLHLDGVLVPVWHDASRRRDAPELPPVRACALAPLVPARGAVGRLAAVWVHAGGPPPRRVDVLVRSGARRPDPHPLRSPAEADLTDADVVVLGGVRVTSLERTAADVARWVEPAAAVTALRTLVAVGLDVAAATRLVDARAGARGVRRARRTLRQV